MALNRTSRRRQKTRDHLAKVAIELFEMHGYEAVTMEQIAADADVARGTLYNHFPVKDAVLAYWIHAELERNLGALTQAVTAHGSLVERLAALMEASARWWEEHRQYAAPYIRYRFQEVRDGHDKQATSDMIAVYVQLITQAQQIQEIGTDASPIRLARYLHFLYLCALMDWLADADILLREELNHVLDFFMKAAAGR